MKGRRNIRLPILQEFDLIHDAKGSDVQRSL
jgi:hypothetical protein